MDKTQETGGEEDVKEFLFLGAPLLDIIAQCRPETLGKYGLKSDDCIRETDQQEALFRLLFDDPDSQMSAGGSSQNSARIAQWTLGNRGRVFFAGCVGEDIYAKTMLDRLQSEGVEALYISLPGDSTGICACLLSSDGDRSMCARLGAAGRIAEHHLREENVRERVRGANSIFVEGYLFGHSPDVLIAVAETCTNNQTLSFTGLLLTTSSVLNFLIHPADPLLRWLLRACYFVDVHGIAFHSVLFIVSTLLACGVVSRVPPLLVPWMAASPLFVLAILTQMVLVILKQPDLAMPVVCFCLMVLLFVIYATLIVASHYRQVSTATLHLRLYNLGDGELPRIVEVPQRFSGPFFIPRYFRGTSSSQPFQQSASESEETRGAEKWPELRHAYARFMRVNPRPSGTTGQPFTREAVRY